MAGLGTVESPERTAGIRRRDPATLDQVIRESLPGLLRAARAAGLPAEQAEDAAHAAVLVFLQRAEAFDGRARASTWLYGILANKVAEARRADTREQGVDDIDQVFEARFDATGTWSHPPVGALEHLAREDARRFIAACLEGVPERQRRTLILRHVDEVDTDTACKILAVSPNNLGVLLFRARARMRECLETSGVRGSADAQV